MLLNEIKIDEEKQPMKIQKFITSKVKASSKDMSWSEDGSDTHDVYVYGGYSKKGGKYPDYTPYIDIYKDDYGLIITPADIDISSNDLTKLEIMLYENWYLPELFPEYEMTDDDMHRIQLIRK